MRASVGILIVLLVCLGGWKVWDHWSRVREQQELGIRVQEGEDIRPEKLPGLPYQLESKLTEARQRGPQTFKQFIDTWRHSPEVKDPRLAWIELDYITMISSSDPVEAKRLFYEVKKRVSTNSVIYPEFERSPRPTNNYGRKSPDGTAFCQFGALQDLLAKQVGDDQVARGLYRCYRVFN